MVAATSALFYTSTILAHWMFAATYWRVSHEMPHILYRFPNLKYNERRFKFIDYLMKFLSITVPPATNYYFYRSLSATEKIGGSISRTFTILLQVNIMLTIVAFGYLLDAIIRIYRSSHEL